MSKFSEKSSRLTEDERGLLKAQKKATPLPYVNVTYDGEQYRVSVDPVFVVSTNHQECKHPSSADAFYLAEAANAVPGLLDEIARLRGERDEATTNAQACAHGECLGCIDFLGWTRPETSAEDAVHTPTAKELRTRADRAEAERDALATIAAAQERALKGDGDGSTVLEEVLRDMRAERDALREAIQSFHDEHHGRGGGPFSRPTPISLSECSDPRCRAAFPEDSEVFREVDGGLA